METKNQAMTDEQLNELIKQMGYDATLSRIAVAMSNALMSDEVYIHNAQTLMKFVEAYEDAGFTREESIKLLSTSDVCGKMFEFMGKIIELADNFLTSQTK